MNSTEHVELPPRSAATNDTFECATVPADFSSFGTAVSPILTKSAAAIYSENVSIKFDES